MVGFMNGSGTEQTRFCGTNPHTGRLTGTRCLHYVCGIRESICLNAIDLTITSMNIPMKSDINNQKDINITYIGCQFTSTNKTADFVASIIDKL